MKNHSERILFKPLAKKSSRKKTKLCLKPAKSTVTVIQTVRTRYHCLAYLEVNQKEIIKMFRQIHTQKEATKFQSD